MTRQDELLEEGEEVGDGRAEGSSAATGEGGQAAVSLTLDIDGMNVRIFGSSQVECSYMGDLQYWLARAAKTKPHRLGGLDNRNVLSHSQSWRLESK